MRPGQQGPGNRDMTFTNMIKDVRFNEAGATRPRKPHVSVTIEEAGLLASMRPGQQGPGNGGGGSQELGLQVASMRPGQQGPGNSSSGLADSVMDLLQ